MAYPPGRNPKCIDKLVFSISLEGSTRQPLLTLARAVVTYDNIFETAKVADMADVALAAANKLLEYIISSHCCTYCSFKSGCGTLILV